MSDQLKKTSSGEQMTREQWMNAVAADLAPVFAKLGKPLPAKIRLSYSLIGRKNTIGICFYPPASADQAVEIVVRFDQSDSVEVAAIIAHELAHAALPIGTKHGAPFAKLVKALGLEGKATATTPGAEFKKLIAPTLARLGDVPHAKLDPSRSTLPKKQGTRMLKVECADCGFTVRMTKVWIETVGPAHCPEHGAMQVEGDEGEGE